MMLGRVGSSIELGVAAISKKLTMTKLASYMAAGCAASTIVFLLYFKKQEFGARRIPRQQGPAWEESDHDSEAIDNLHL